MRQLSPRTNFSSCFFPLLNPYNSLNLGLKLFCGDRGREAVHLPGISALSRLKSPVCQPVELHSLARLALLQIIVLQKDKNGK